MTIYLPLLSVIAVSLISFVGIFTISIREDLVKKYIFLFVSLAVGALLGDSFIHLIPEGLEQIPDPSTFSILIIAGILIFFIIEKYLHWHHHYETEDLNTTIHPVGKIILLSDGVHNFIDGLIIGSSYLVSIELGVATTLAVVLHEIPQEFGDFGVLLYSGYTRARALMLNFASALTSVFGVLLVMLIGQASSSISMWLIPFAAGGFIYIALSDLIPELHKKSDKNIQSVFQLVMIAIGVMSMLLLLKLE